MRGRCFPSCIAPFFFTAALSWIPLQSALAQNVVVDNDDGAPGYAETSPWTVSALAGYNNGSYHTLHSSDTLSTATWTCIVPVTGAYDVYSIFNRGSNRTAGAPYVIEADSQLINTTVDMQGLGLDEVLLATIMLDASTTVTVSLSNSGGAGYYVADAVRVKMHGALAPVADEIRAIPPQPVNDEIVTIVARVIDDVDPASTVTIHYRTDSNVFGTVQAYDDGLHGDGEIGDYIYGGIMPDFGAGTVVMYSVETADSLGNSAESRDKYYRVNAFAGVQTDMFIMAGQSNACGPGELSSTNETSDSRVVMFANDYNWKIAYEPLNDMTGAFDHAICPWTPTTVRGHTFGLGAGKLLLAPSRTIEILPCARGGTSIAEWRRGADSFDQTTLYGSLNSRVRDSCDAPRAMWWYQGESDASSSTFTADHTALMGEIRDAFGVSMPIIYAQLASHTTSGANTNHFRTGEKQRRMESGSGYSESIASHFMVVTFDLPHYDSIHLNQEAVKELGRRIGLATRQHVYGENIDGTGPRLALENPVRFTDSTRTIVQVRFTSAVNTAVNNFDHQFRVFDSTGEIAGLQVERHLGDHSSVLVALPHSATGAATVSYGEVPCPGLDTWLPNVLKGANDLPVPRFGRLTIADSDSQVTDWKFY